jgi:hypothetical protein
MVNITKGKTVEGCGDAITGERIHKGEDVVFTGFKNKSTNWMKKGRYRVIKEETIVELAKAAGLKLCGDNCDCKSDERVSEPAPRVERADASPGGGTVKAGKAKTGGRKAYRSPIGDSAGD